MALGVSRKDGEDWRDCVIRYAAKYGLETECLSEFDAAIAGGVEPPQAAWEALYEWDVLDFFDDAVPHVSA